uniref:N-terminal E2 ubiquitin-conjugating enzyme n=3 Tax=Neognathae TaxID=8825 RepID=A0A669QM46_PHACC
MASMQKRLQKELLALQNDPPPGMTLNEKSVQNSITQWIVDMEGAPGTLYEGEKFQLLFKFSSRYPFDSPQVMFTGDNIPVHPHVYSNGHICLSILTEDWSPALSVQSVCLSIISMLSSCKEKRRPPDNSFYVRTCNKNPKKTKWWYHGKYFTRTRNFEDNSNVVMKDKCIESLKLINFKSLQNPVSWILDVNSVNFCVSYFNNSQLKFKQHRFVCFKLLG